VLVREENPPEGEERIEWLLLTSLPGPVRNLVSPTRIGYFMQPLF
jgi:hypothetical protein